jgi:hypothetical protein
MWRSAEARGSILAAVSLAKDTVAEDAASEVAIAREATLAEKVAAGRSRLAFGSEGASTRNW